MKQTFRSIVAPDCKYYVYFIYLQDKVHPVYVGKGSRDRYRHYFYYPDRVANRILRSKLLKLKEEGRDYFVEFIFETEDEQEALDAEEFYISYYGRLFNQTGVLYNFESGGIKSSLEQPNRRKAVYIDGFVFDSVGRAMEVTGIKGCTLKKYTEIGRASYLENDEQVQRVFERERKLKYHYFYGRHKKAFKRARKIMLISESRMGDKNWMKGKATAISRKIKIDGVVYRSLNQAAQEFGYSKGDSLRKFLERGNHSHNYEFIDN